MLSVDLLCTLWLLARKLPLAAVLSCAELCPADGTQRPQTSPAKRPLLCRQGSNINSVVIPGGTYRSGQLPVFLSTAIRLAADAPLTVSWAGSPTGLTLPVAAFVTFQFNGPPPPPPSPPSPPPPPPPP